MTRTDQIKECERRLLRTVHQADTAALEALLHEQLVFHLPNGQLLTKSADLATYRTGAMRVAALAASDEHITLVNDIAVVSVVVALQGSYFGQPLDSRMRYLRVWTWNGTAWQVTAGSCIALWGQKLPARHQLRERLAGGERASRGQRTTQRLLRRVRA